MKEGMGSPQYLCYICVICIGWLYTHRRVNVMEKKIKSINMCIDTILLLFQPVKHSSCFNDPLKATIPLSITLVGCCNYLRAETVLITSSAFFALPVISSTPKATFILHLHYHPSQQYYH